LYALLFIASPLSTSGCVLLATDGEIGGSRSPTHDAGGDAADAADASAADAAEDAPLDGAPPAQGARGTGAYCGVNGRDDCGPFMACDPAGGCVECVDDAQCPRSAPYCVAGSCVFCREASADGGAPPDAGSDCPPETPSCFPLDHECHPQCTGPASCPESAPFCDLASGECWGCRSDGDCASGACDETSRQCVECRVDDDCPAKAPRCRTLHGTCEECASNDDCGLTAPVCDPATFRCRVGCTADAQCPGQRCDPQTALCVPAPHDGGAG
jgi:Cys-rich repeat protein